MFRLCALVLVALPAVARADAFDHYTNPVLAKAIKSGAAEAVKQVTPEQLLQHSRVLPQATAAMVIVKTNGERLAKLLVLPASQKVAGGAPVPIIVIDRFITFREGDERTVQAAGQNVRLFADFCYDLDIGQVVPAKLGGDVRVAVKDGRAVLEPVGKAELFVLTKPVPDATVKRPPRPVVGEKFETRFFNGVYKLYDDGRRSGTLHLKVAANGDVDGYYYSDKDGQKYEVGGKAGNPPHAINFVITFPRSIQHFHGLMFTGDGRAIAGSSRLQDRETAFYAVREEDAM
jgi:hypothetical protein